MDALVPLKLDETPILRPVPDSDRWEVVQDWHCGEFTVPAGYRTDLESVPRVPFLYAAFKDRFETAALLHDWLYDAGIDKPRADLEFLRLMLRESPTWREKYIIAYPTYYAVKLFGGPAYAKSAWRTKP